MRANRCIRRPTVRSIVAVVAFVALSCNAATTIYKCHSADGGVLYTDAPCLEAEMIEVHAGSADPGAIDRLARDAQLASERYAQQRAAAALFELEQQRISQARPIETPPPDAGTYCEYCGGWATGITAAEPPQRHRHRATRRPPAFVRAR
jgi:hypothetical protein